MKSSDTLQDESAHFLIKGFEPLVAGGGATIFIWRGYSPGGLCSLQTLFTDFD